MTFSIERIDHIVLRARDPERLAAFYRDALGCAEERRIPSIGLIQLRAGASLLDLVPRTPDAGGTNMDHYCFRVAPFDADAIRARLAANGAVAGNTVERYGADGTGPSIYFDDPEGNQVELKGPPTSPPVATAR